MCATSKGEPWLVEAQEAVLAGADRRLTLAARARAVKTVEGRLSVAFADREEALRATSSGPALLQEVLGKRSYGDAPLSFSARERGLEGVERRIDEELRTQEEALWAIPPARRYLSAAEQVRTAEAAGPPTLADRESMVRAATLQAGEELDRLEEELLAIAVGEDLLAEAAGVLAGAGRTRSLGEQWEACERVKSGVEEDLDHREAAVRADPAGEEFLRDARLEVLGSAEREAATLGERARIVKAAAEAKRRAETWNEEKAARVEKLGALPGGLDLYHAHLADRDPKWNLTENTPPSRELDEAALAAAESDATRLKRLRGVLSSDESDAACYREVLDRAVGQFQTSDLDSALTAAEQARKDREWEEQRDARVDALANLPGGLDLYHAHLADLDPKWSKTENDTTARRNIDVALTAAESDDIRLKRLDAVLSDESDAACYQEVLDQAVGQFATSDVDNALSAGEKARAEREMQQWEEKRDAVVEELRALPGGLDLYHAHLADRDPKWDNKRNRKSSRENIDAALAAARSDAPRLDRLRDVLSDAADATHYREVLDDSPDQFSTATLDRALAAGEGARAEREASALETATEEAQAAAARSNVELRDAHLRAIYETGETHAAGLAAVSRTTEALNAAADQRLPADTIIGTWNGSRSEPGGIAAALDAAAAAVSARRASALETATEEAQAAAARSKVELRDAHVRVIYETGETHESGLSAVERTTAALAAAADQQLPTKTIISIWNANESAPGGIAGALATRTRVSRLERLFGAPRAAETFIVALDGRDPSSRTPTHPDVDRALDIAEREFGPGASSAPGRRAGDDVTEAVDTDRDVRQVIDRLRTEVERQQQLDALRARTGAARLNERNRNSLRRPVVSPPVPKPDRLVPDATWEDAKLVLRALTDLENATDRGRLDERARHAVRPVAQKSPPVRKLGRLVPDATREDAVAADLVRAEREQERRQTAASPRLTFDERYIQEWPKHAADIQRSDFQRVSAAVEARNELFERRELYSSSKWTTVEPKELPIALAKPAPAWTNEAVKEVTWRATPGVGPERTMSRRIVDAHLDDYEHGLPEQYAYSAEWRAIRERAEEAVRKLQDGLRYKWADRKEDDRKKRKLEAAAINGACGWDARRLHGEMMAARETARPDWEVIVRIRAVRDAIHRDERIKLKQEQQPRERPARRQPKRGPTRDRKSSRAR